MFSIFDGQPMEGKVIRVGILIIIKNYIECMNQPVYSVYTIDEIKMSSEQRNFMVNANQFVSIPQQFTEASSSYMIRFLLQMNLAIYERNF